MNFIEKAILINLFGDEWGGGEAWDAYQLWKLWHYNKRLVLLIIGGIFLLIGGVLLGVHATKKYKNNKAMLWSGVVFVSLAVVLFAIVAAHYLFHASGKGNSIF